MECVHILPMISIFWLIESNQANFDMITSKNYDHYFLDLYQDGFEEHMKYVSEKTSFETELIKYTEDMNSGGLVKKWAYFEGWNLQSFIALRQHFLFAVRTAMEVEHILPILILIHVKHQVFLHAITYMNGVILLPENDHRANYCRDIATQLLYFSDVGMMDLLQKLESILEIKLGKKNKFTVKIIRTLNTWAIAANMIWERFQPQLTFMDSSKNSPNDMTEKLYQKLCDDQDKILIESKKAMMSLFEGMKQRVAEPILPPMERLTLNFAVASNLWDNAETTWVQNFRPSKGKFQLKAMIMEDDVIEMRFYGELNADMEEDLNFDDLKSFNLLIFDGNTGIIKLAKNNKGSGTTEQGKESNKETEIINLENSNQDKLSRKRKNEEVII